MRCSEPVSTHASRRGRSVGARGLLPLCGVAVALALGISACGGSTNQNASDPTPHSALQTTAAVSHQATSHRATSRKAPKHDPAVTGRPSGHRQHQAGDPAQTTANHSSAVPTSTAPQASTTPIKTTPADSSTTKTSGPRPKPHRKPPKPYHATVGTGPAVTPIPKSGTATVPGVGNNSPSYVGPSPLGCLSQSGLSDARAGVEANVWLANVPNSPLQDSNSIVLLSGPYPTAGDATRYAQSLTAIPELAVSSGRWVASASFRSKLSAVVQSAASCMAGS